jgi:hypothetical protein
MFRIKGYTGNCEVPELPDMDIDRDIADITYAQRYQEEQKKPEFVNDPYGYNPNNNWAIPDVDMFGKKRTKLVAIVR